MSNILRFSTLSYSYDFSIPRIVKCGESTHSEFNFYVRDEEVFGLFGSEIDSLHLDWIDLAIAVYVADRLSLREIEKYRNNWKRNLKLKIAVRNLGVWLCQDIQAEFKNILNFYTDDDWEFEFVNLESDERMKGINNKVPFKPNTDLRVALFSGGLDSFAGATQQLFLDNESSFMFVSGATNNRQVSLQRRQIKRLQDHYRTKEIYYKTVNFGFNWIDSDHPKEENSQRTRGFVFATLGAVTALNAGTNVLEVYENGIGAINLPYDGSQVGTMNSRGVNPMSLLRMERFIQTLTKQDFKIRNLYLFQTKGEMCQHKAVRNLADAISLTFSCDGFPVREAHKPQCGVCTSCLLRRLSIETADLNSFDSGEHFVTDLALPISSPSFDQLNDLRAMEWQYQTIINCLSSKDVWQNLMVEYPTLQTIVSELAAHEDSQIEDIQNSILLLYSQYCAEWESFSARQNYINLKRKAA